MRTKGTLVILLLAGSAHAAESPFSTELSARARYDDNIGFAPDDPSRKDVFSTRVSGTVSWAAVSRPLDSARVVLTPFYEGVQKLEDLSNYGVSLGASYRHQLNEAVTAPWVSLQAQGTLLRFEDSDLRDGYLVDAELAVGKELGARLGVAFGYRYQNRVSTKNLPEGTILDARSNEVFDQERDGPFAKVEYSPAPRTTLFGEYQYVEGEVAATGSPQSFENGSEFARARDFAFEEGIGLLAWRIPAEQHAFTLGASQALGERFVLELTGMYQDASSDSGNDYDNWTVSGELRFSF